MSNPLNVISKKDLVYWNIFLINLIVVAVTKFWGSDAKLVEQLSFACTITSLILSTIAIIYSFIQTLSSNSINESLNKSTENISTAADEIKIATSRLALIDNIADDLSIVSKELAIMQANILKVENEVCAVKNETSASFDLFAERFSSLIHSKTSKTSNTSVNEIDKQYISKLMVENLNYGCYVVYFLLRCFDKNIEYNVPDLVKAIEIDEQTKEAQALYHGFFVSVIMLLDSLKLFEVVDSTNYKSKISFYSDELRAAIMENYEDDKESYDEIFDRLPSLK